MTKAQIHPSIPRNFVWTADENGWVPVVTKLAQTQFSTLLSANALRRDADELNCTDLCSCSDSGELWQNMNNNFLYTTAETSICYL